MQAGQVVPGQPSSIYQRMRCFRNYNITVLLFVVYEEEVTDIHTEEVYESSQEAEEYETSQEPVIYENSQESVTFEISQEPDEIPQESVSENLV